MLLYIPTFSAMAQAVRLVFSSRSFAASRRTFTINSDMPEPSDARNSFRKYPEERDIDPAMASIESSGSE